MSGTDTADAPTKSVEELQKELAAAESKYEKLNSAHERLKQDHANLKSTQSDQAELQKQIERHVHEKTKLLREKEELEGSFSDYRKEVRKKEALHALTAELQEAGAKKPATALKLIDMESVKFDDNGQVIPESLKAAVAALKEAEGDLLFNETTPNKGRLTTPSIKPAVDRMTQSAYETEIAAAVKAGDQQALEEVFAKYHKS